MPRIAPVVFTLLVSLLAWPVINHAAEPSPVGRYVLTGMREVGSELILSADGQFEYMLAYGAYDEQASGTWQLKGKQVILNTRGEAVAPRFTLKSSAHHPEPGVSVQVVNGSGSGLATIDVRVMLDGDSVQEGYTQTYGYHAGWNKAAAPRAIALSVQMYQVDWQTFQDFPATHNQFVFAFDPGTLGTAQFRDLAFEWDGASLTVVREGQPMRYVKR